MSIGLYAVENEVILDIAQMSIAALEILEDEAREHWLNFTAQGFDGEREKDLLAFANAVRSEIQHRDVPNPGPRVVRASAKAETTVAPTGAGGKAITVNINIHQSNEDLR